MVLTDVAFFQNLIFRGNAVTHHFVDACTYTFGKSFVVERCGSGAMGHGIVVDEFVDVGSAHASVYLFFHEVKHTRVYFA